MSLFVTPLRGLAFSFLIASSASLAACGDDGDDGGNGGPAEWSEIELAPEPGSLSGVWGSAADDVFAVGGNDDTAHIYHFDGSEWTLMDTPEGAPLQSWAYGFGGNDVWSVGVDGSILRYDGTSWTTLDSGTDQDLWGVWGESPNDVYIVGGTVADGQVTILHWNGSALEPEELPAEENPQGIKALFKVFGIGGKVFAVGQRGMIAERVDGAWVKQGAGAAADDDFVSLWGTSADHIVAVGGRIGARVAVYDGSTWTTFAPEGKSGLNAVYFNRDDLAIVGGIFGGVGTFNEETNDIDQEDSPATLDVHAIWCDLEGTCYGVGGTFFDPHIGLLMERK